MTFAFQNILFLLYSHHHNTIIYVVVTVLSCQVSYRANDPLIVPPKASVSGRCIGVYSAKFVRGWGGHYKDFFQEFWAE